MNQTESKILPNLLSIPTGQLWSLALGENKLSRSAMADLQKVLKIQNIEIENVEDFGTFLLTIAKHSIKLENKL